MKGEIVWGAELNYSSKQQTQMCGELIVCSEKLYGFSILNVKFHVRLLK